MIRRIKEEARFYGRMAAPIAHLTVCHVKNRSRKWTQAIKTEGTRWGKTVSVRLYQYRNAVRKTDWRSRMDQAKTGIEHVSGSIRIGMQRLKERMREIPKPDLKGRMQIAKTWAKDHTDRAVQQFKTRRAHRLEMRKQRELEAEKKKRRQEEERKQLEAQRQEEERRAQEVLRIQQEQKEQERKQEEEARANTPEIPPVSDTDLQEKTPPQKQTPQAQPIGNPKRVVAYQRWQSHLHAPKVQRSIPNVQESAQDRKRDALELAGIVGAFLVLAGVSMYLIPQLIAKALQILFG